MPLTEAAPSGVNIKFPPELTKLITDALSKGYADVIKAAWLNGFILGAIAGVLGVVVVMFLTARNK